jgi:phosphatidylglycerophosphate synthase
MITGWIVTIAVGLFVLVAWFELRSKIKNQEVCITTNNKKDLKVLLIVVMILVSSFYFLPIVGIFLNPNPLLEAYLLFCIVIFIFNFTIWNIYKEVKEVKNDRR